MLDEQELELIKKYFDGVNYKLSKIYTCSPTLYETDLTSYLGQFLNTGSVMHEELSYNMDDLNDELSTLGKGGYLKVKFETSEYTTGHESKYNADIGFVVRIDTSPKPITKAVLVQCKSLKLYKGEFSVESKYNQLVKKRKDEITQFEKIVDCEYQYKLDYCYLLYNPLFTTFTDKKTINSYEEKISNSTNLKCSPGIKMTDTNFIANIGSNIPSLGDCYQKSLEYPIGINFISFSSFITSLLDCNYGDKDNQMLINIVEGNNKQSGIRVKNKVDIGYFSD